MLTGDNERSAASIAVPLGMDYKARLLPADKVTFINELASQHRVAMVGDGINDAPAMKASNIGVCNGGRHGCGARNGRCRFNAQTA